VRFETGSRSYVDDFMTVCFDEMANQAAKARYMFGGKAKVPMVCRTINGPACLPPPSTLSLWRLCWRIYLD
jgi:hypothetical protein